MTCVRVDRALQAADWRIGLYWTFSEAGTVQSAEADVQAQEYRRRLAGAAECAVADLNGAHERGQQWETLTSLTRRILALHNAPVATFPERYNRTQLRLCEDEERPEDSGTEGK